MAPLGARSRRQDHEVRVRRRLHPGVKPPQPTHLQGIPVADHVVARQHVPALRDHLREASQPKIGAGTIAVVVKHRPAAGPADGLGQGFPGLPLRVPHDPVRAARHEERREQQPGQQGARQAPGAGAPALGAPPGHRGDRGQQVGDELGSGKRKEQRREQHEPGGHPRGGGARRTPWRGERPGERPAREHRGHEPPRLVPLEAAARHAFERLFEEGVARVLRVAPQGQREPAPRDSEHHQPAGRPGEPRERCTRAREERRARAAADRPQEHDRAFEQHAQRDRREHRGAAGVRAAGRHLERDAGPHRGDARGERHVEDHVGGQRGEQGCRRGQQRHVDVEAAARLCGRRGEPAGGACQ